MQPKIALWLNTPYRRCHFPRPMTTNCWRSVDAHFQDGAGRVLLSVLPIMAAKNSFRSEYNLSEMWFPRTHDQKWLTLRWRSFSGWGREDIAVCFASKGGLNFFCDWLQPIGGVISQDAWPKIVDAPLMLILPWLYPQYAIIHFGTIHHSLCFSCLSGVFINFLLDHYVVL